MEPKYKVGDKVVIVRKVPGKEYSLIFFDSMAKLSGTVSTVEAVDMGGRYNSYKLTTVGYWWSEDMLVPFNPDPYPKYSDFIPKKKHYSLNFRI